MSWCHFCVSSLGGSSQLRPMVPVRRSGLRKWEPGILWSLHRGHTATVLGQSLSMWMYIMYRYCSYKLCVLKDISKRLKRLCTALNTGAEGHSLQNICNLYPHLEFYKHIIFQLITILCKWQQCWSWNLCRVVCFCKSDIFIPTLMGIIWGRKNSLTSKEALKG